MSALRYYLDGPPDAPVVVLLHAIATNSTMWIPQLGAWSSQFRIVRVDLPGHGASVPDPQVSTLRDYAAKVVDVLDELDIKRAAVVGLSFGGMIAQAIALDHSDRLKALVLAHSGARTEAAVRELWNRRLASFEAHGLAAQAMPTLERWFTKSFARESPMTMDWLAEQIRSTSSEGYVAAVHAIQGLDHLERLHEIEVPTLVVAGEEDSAIPPAAARAIAERIPGSRLILLEQTAHFGNIQQPILFTEKVGAFLLTHLFPAH